MTSLLTQIKPVDHLCLIQNQFYNISPIHSNGNHSIDLVQVRPNVTIEIRNEGLKVIRTFKFYPTSFP